ncbi:hypothetical protein VP1G_07871 [Cytospora mali]|uniref:Uncharacterized protein n=1 Tax=Cytospora mali TaxID=578113 RepID=A0A194V9M6_CYTMA|nr:hypothetical protein VP1G_07871 [Valsa mali var. pyri (nom. inval.)]
MLFSSLKRSCLLPLLGHIHHQCASAYDPASGSAVSGNLDIEAPYGIPSDKFGSDTSNPDYMATFNITGYNISSNSGPRSALGWKLAAGIKDGVSLSDATNSSVNKDQVFEATTLYLEAPSGMKMDASWKICAIVYPGLNANPSEVTTTDGTCNGILSAECIQSLTVAAEGPTSNGMDTNGRCINFILPARCTSSFPTNSINTSSITINQTILDNERFYAYGSAPVKSDDTTSAADEARQNMWTVITIFGHVSSSGFLASGNAGIQCIRPSNGTPDASNGTSSPSDSKGTSVDD